MDDRRRRGDRARVGILGGSGLYALAAVEDAREVEVQTPFGRPSDAVVVGRLAGVEVAFLARHGRRHTLLPSEIDVRANVFALKTLGVERVLAASAVGSLSERIHPREVVLVDQFIDRAPHRRATFFGDGLVAHVGFADPVCRETRGALLEAARSAGAQAHDGGTYVCMEGPAFSTRAESHLYRSWGADVIGMTNLHEAKLCREAELCYAVLALVTDYDCWHEGEPVSVATLLDNLSANADLAARALTLAVERLGPRGCDCGRALDHAIVTPLDAVPEATLARLAPILARRLGRSAS